MTWLLSILSSFLGPIIAGAGGLIALLIGKWLWNRKNAKIEQQAEIIKAHERIEQTHRQDVIIDTDTEKKIQDIEDKVDHAENQEEAAGEISVAIDDYFKTGTHEDKR